MIQPRYVESSESPAHVREEIGQAHTRRIAKGTGYCFVVGQGKIRDFWRGEGKREGEKHGWIRSPTACTRALRKLVDGEAQPPTQLWAGMGCVGVIKDVAVVKCN